MDHGDDGRYGHLPFEPKRDVDGDEDEEDDERGARLVGDGLAPRRAHIVDADLTGARVRHFGQCGADLVLLGRRHMLELHTDDVAARGLDLGFTEAEGADGAADRRDRRVGRFQLPRDAALEVDAQVEALGGERCDADGDHDA